MIYLLTLRPLRLLRPAPVSPMASPRSGRVASVNVSPGGVPKLPVAEQWVGRMGLADDRHPEPEPMHGGVDQAVCLYSVEAIARVSAVRLLAFPSAFA